MKLKDYYMHNGLSIYQTKDHVSCLVAYLGYGRHGTCHGRHFDGGTKIAWQKLKSLCTVS